MSILFKFVKLHQDGLECSVECLKYELAFLECLWGTRVAQDIDQEKRFFYLHQPHRPAQRPKTGLIVIGDEPCRLNGTTQALGEPVEVNHLRRTIHRVPRGSSPPDRPGGLTLPLRPSASHHRQRIPVRQLSEDYLVPDNLGSTQDLDW